MTVPERVPIAESRRWQLLRAGIQNVWEYDDQRFVFHHGRLMLRGQNESGKTKALEVLLPFILDASLQPHRLDPFGSTARSMRWNLINDSNPAVNVNIGYVWLELGRLGESGAEYWTLGAGLKARRTSPQLDDWYFATSRRVDCDLELAPNRTPLTRPNLESALGASGTVFESAAHYRRALNEKLFGLGEDQYGALVDALLQLRRPQLSKGLDPVELSNILSASLPPLDGQVVGSLAEGFERLDRHRTEREECRATLDAVRGFLGVYKQYAASVTKGRALEVTRADSAFHAARTKQKDAEAKRDAAKAKLEELAAQLQSLETEGITLEERIRVLQESDAFRAVSELEAAERRAKGTREAADRAGTALAQGKDRAARKETGVTGAKAVAEQDARDLDAERRAASAAAESCGLAEAHGAMVHAVADGQQVAARDTLTTALRMRAETLDALKKLTRVVDEATQTVNVATVRAASADERAREAKEAVDRAAAAESAAQARLLEDIEAWAAGAKELRLDAAAVAELPPERMRAFAEAAAAQVRSELDVLSRAAALALDTAARELDVTREARAALEAQKHQPPAPPAWRTARTPDRPGAPLYLLCDFAPQVEPAARAGLEAALEAAGLLDAWITPDGQVLDAQTFDSVLKAHPLSSGRTLADALCPAEGAAVAPEHVSAVLRSIGLGEMPSASAWVAEDGRFVLGPLEGRSGKSEAGFIGAAARERARRERLAELSREISRLEVVVAEGARAVEAIQRRRATLEAELGAFPDVQPLRDRQSDVRARTDELTAARRLHAEELERLRRAEGARVAAAQKLDERAAEAGLRGWLGRLEDLAERTAAWKAAAGTLLVAFERARRSRADLEARRAELAELMQQVQQLGAAADEARRQAVEAAARASELAATIGKDHEELLASLRAAEQRKQQVRAEQTRRRDEQATAQSEWGALEAGVGAAGLKVEETDAARRDAELRFRVAEGRGLLAMLGVVGPRPAPEWSWTDVLTTARKVDDATAKVDASDGGRDKAWNRVSERHQELMRALKPELKVLASQGDGVTVYEATWNARKLTLLELDTELEGDLAARDRLLADEERRLFESFLTGEAHEHLRERLREASSLVRRMNKQLDAHPTSSGMVMRLKWDVAENAAPGTKEAVALLFKSGELMSDADREALMGFLRQRLDEARNGGDAARPLQEQLLAVLDYRRWHLFEVECRVGAEGWKRLTRKVHAAGSGGQKAVMLHLPLFAAAAAFYDSAREGAPRFILLDEAFAGIDRQTRGELMGLLADFDLDFVMTSFEEWGFYPQLDGLSTYHLAREKGMPGVYSDWFVWNGREPIQMQG